MPNDLAAKQIDALVKFDISMATEAPDQSLVAAAKYFLGLTKDQFAVLADSLRLSQAGSALFTNLLVKSSRIVLAGPPSEGIELIYAAANVLSNDIIGRDNTLLSQNYRYFVDAITNRYGPLVTLNVFSEVISRYPDLKPDLGVYDSEALNVILQHEEGIDVVGGSDQRLINAAAYVIYRKDACGLVLDEQRLSGEKNVVYGKAANIILASAGIHQERSLVVDAAALQASLLKEGGYQHIYSDFDLLALNFGHLSTEELSAHIAQNWALLLKQVFMPNTLVPNLWCLL